VLEGGRSMKTLSNIKVLDLSRVLAGPYSAMILGDLGAEIIKIEVPNGGDDTRKWGPPFIKSESAYYMTANRNKRSITLNLNTEEGRKVLLKLIKSSDVLIHNFKAGTMEKWGLSYHELQREHDQLIYCAISGFGESGPLKGQPGYDAIIQAMAGLMSITGSKESGPMKVGVAVADLTAGLHASIAILAALFERTSSGKGQKLDISLFDSQISLLANVASNFLLSGNTPELLGNEHPNIVPYQPFLMKDGKQLIIAVGNDKQFTRLCSAFDLQRLTEDKRFQTNESRLKNRKELISILQHSFKKISIKEAQEKLNDIGVPNGPILNVKEVFEHPQTIAREMLSNVAHPFEEKLPLVGSPLKFSRTPVTIDRHPPLLGEHTTEILTELGFSKEQINLLKKEKII
jgi:crotonobetainyl-CoA:carnitine CoA-transferase CaiB-like acyl-CoA transferase